jgi:adenosylcobyric acid synthase
MASAPCFLSGGIAGARLPAYEIHMGQVVARSGVQTPFSIRSRNGVAADAADGAIGADGNVVGTLLHGLLEHEGVRSGLLRSLWEKRGTARAPQAPVASAAEEYDRLEAHVRQHLDLDLLRKLARVG